MCDRYWTISACVPVLHLRVSYPLDAEVVRDFARELKIVCPLRSRTLCRGCGCAARGSGVEVFLASGTAGAPFIPSHGEVHPEQLAHLLAVDWESLAARLNASLLAGRAYESIPRRRCPVGDVPITAFRSLEENRVSDRLFIHSRDSGHDNGVFIFRRWERGSIYSGWAPLTATATSFNTWEMAYFHSGRGPSKAAGRSQHYILASV